MKKEQLASHLSTMFDFSITSDTEWTSSRGGRCITDYSREITFSRELSSEELNLVKKTLAETDCPGWTGVSGYLADKEKMLYRFSTTWDSSD